MAAESGTHGTGTARYDGEQARHAAACAIQLVARSLGVEPAALSAAAYRGYCARQGEMGLPSSLAISVLFVGWQRAREQASALTYDEGDVEANVIRVLYGDPSRRHRAYATTGHDRTAPPLCTAVNGGRV